MEHLPEDAVGRRVLCDGERATVRYIGTVPPTAGEHSALHTISKAETFFLTLIVFYFIF